MIVVGVIAGIFWNFMSWWWAFEVALYTWLSSVAPWL
jgi:hypothetical protein